MQPRRSLALVAGALVLALPVLSSCGFDKATDKVYTPGVGVNDRDGDVDVLAAVIVAAQPGSGTFIASLANNSSTEAAQFESLSGGSGNAVTTGDIDPPIKIDPRGFVNLADDGGVSVSGSFGAGDFIPLTLNFTDGDTVLMNVPVVYACDEYDGLDTSTTDTADASPAPATVEPYDCADIDGGGG